MNTKEKKKEKIISEISEISHCIIAALTRKGRLEAIFRDILREFTNCATNIRLFAIWNSLQNKKATYCIKRASQPQNITPLHGMRNKIYLAINTINTDMIQKVMKLF